MSFWSWIKILVPRFMYCSRSVHFWGFCNNPMRFWILPISGRNRVPPTPCPPAPPPNPPQPHAPPQRGGHGGHMPLSTTESDIRSFGSFVSLSHGLSQFPLSKLFSVFHPKKSNFSLNFQGFSDELIQLKIQFSIFFKQKIRT